MGPAGALTRDHSEGSLGSTGVAVERVPASSGVIFGPSGAQWASGGDEWDRERAMARPAIGRGFNAFIAALRSSWLLNRYELAA